MTAMLIGVGSYLFAGILSLVLPRFKFQFSLLGWIGGFYGVVRVITFLQTKGSAVRSLGGWRDLGIEITVDQTTVLFTILIVTINVFTLLYLGKEKRGTFYCLYNLLLGTAFSLSFSNDLFNLYVTIELLSLTSILLIGYERKAYQIYAGIKYLLLSSLSMSLYLIGLAIIYKSSGYLAISKLAKVVSNEPGFTVSLALSLMITGLAVKGGVFLFSMWLPDAHSYCSSVVSVLLSAMAIKCGLIGIIRLSEITGFNQNLLWLGAMTGIMGVAFAIFEKRPKKLLAYHTISQMGYILLGVGTGTSLGIIAASLYILFHGTFKGILFLSVGHAGIGGSNLYLIDEKKVPLVSKIGLVVGSLSILALPPFNGYLSKILLLEHASQTWVRYSIVAIGLGTAISFIKLNWILLPKKSIKNLSGKGASLLAFSCAVALSGFLTLLILDVGEIAELFTRFHVVQAVGTLAAGSVIFLASKKALREVKLPSFPFNLDNSLISFITGTLIFVILLVFI